MKPDLARAGGEFFHLPIILPVIKDLADKEVAPPARPALWQIAGWFVEPVYSLRDGIDLQTS